MRTLLQQRHDQYSHGLQLTSLSYHILMLFRRRKCADADFQFAATPNQIKHPNITGNQDMEIGRRFRGRFTPIYYDKHILSIAKIGYHTEEVSRSLEIAQIRNYLCIGSEKVRAGAVKYLGAGYVLYTGWRFFQLR